MSLICWRVRTSDDDAAHGWDALVRVSGACGRVGGNSCFGIEARGLCHEESCGEWNVA